MTEQEIIQNAEKYACPENSSLFNREKERVMTNFIAGARWANNNMLKEVLEWLDENFYEHEDFSFDFVEDTPYQCPVRCDFENKEHMIKSFKERFNIE